MDFQLNDEQRLFRQTLRDFVDREIVPVARDWERSGRYPTEIVEGMRKLGLFGLLVPEEYGGLAADTVSFALTFEEISRGWMGIAGILGSHSVSCWMIAHHGTPEQRARYLPELATGERRTGIAMNYCAGFIRQQENQQLGIPPPTVRGFSPRLQELVERLTGSHLDDTRENIDGDTVIPDLTRLVGQWKLGQAGDEIREGLVAVVHAGSAIKAVVELLHLRPADAIDHSGGMAQQVLDDHRPLLRLANEFGLAGRGVLGLDADHHVPEFGKILVDRGGEIELAVLDQHHGGDAGDRLGHRGDPEDRIGL